MGGNHHRRARTGHSNDFNNDVRARRRTCGLGAPHAPVARDPKAHRWIHGIRAARIHPREYAALPPWWSAPGGEAGRALASACPRARTASRVDQEFTSVLGKPWLRKIDRMFATRRK